MPPQKRTASPWGSLRDSTSPAATRSHTPRSTADSGTRAAPAADRAFLERLRNGDDSAFAELIDCYHGPLLRLAMIFVSSRAVAEEVVQDTWLGVLDGLVSFEGRSTLKTWVFRILANRAKTRAVRERRSLPFSDIFDTGAGSEPAVNTARFRDNGAWEVPPRRWEHATADRLLMSHQAVQRLKAAIAALPENQRAVVTLRDVEGLDSEEACRLLGITEINQRVLLHRARSKLRAELEGYFERT